MSSQNLGNSTLREFFNRVKGHRLSTEQTSRNEWERVRWQTHWLINIQLGTGDKIAIKDMILFPWEKSDKIEITKDQRDAAFKKWDKDINLKYANTREP